MQRRAFWLVGLILIATGCESDDGVASGTAGGRVAIVDLDDVFRRLGREAETQKELTDKKSALDRELADLQEKLLERREAKAKEFGEEPTEEQTKELQALTFNLQTEYAREERRAQQEFDRLRLSLRNRFREEVRPVARDIAAARGRDVVLTKTDMVLLAPDESDITDAVVERMLGRPEPAKKAE